MLGIEPGREYDPDDLEKGRKRLQRLEVFSTQALTEAGQIGDNGILPLELSVSERKRRRIGVGATASTTDGIGTEAYWLHRNLFGKAESLKITGKIAGIGRSANFGKVDYSLGAMFRKPGIIDQDTDFVANLTGSRENIDSYTKSSIAGSAGLEHYFTDRITGRASLFADHAKFKDAYGKRNFTTAGIDAGLTVDARDIKLDPTRGYYAGFEVKPFEEFNYGNPGIRAVADLRAYKALDSDGRLVAAGRVKGGMLAGPSISETPPDLLFLAGGGGSVRGYGYKTIGIAGPGGQTVGGKSLLEMSGEVRFKATDTIGVVGFVDAGAVGTDSFSFVSTDLKTSAGIGLRYFTGLGPIRLDMGVPLNKGPDDPSFALYAGIGQAF
jgi:translocation and assembly module TamA